MSSKFIGKNLFLHMGSNKARSEKISNGFKPPLYISERVSILDVQHSLLIAFNSNYTMLQKIW